jgi:hypothetical protein
MPPGCKAGTSACTLFSNHYLNTGLKSRIPNSFARQLAGLCAEAAGLRAYLKPDARACRTFNPRRQLLVPEKSDSLRMGWAESMKNN